jgi:DNA-binding HxlR family transcriptional regulator
MSRSKLEKYLNILDTLIPNPKRFEEISYETKIECNSLKRYLGFLATHKLVEKRLSDERDEYAVTDRGLAVFKTLKAKEYFKRIRSILPVVNEAKQVTTMLSETSDEKEVKTNSE